MRYQSLVKFDCLHSKKQKKKGAQNTILQAKRETKHKKLIPFDALDSDDLTMGN